MGNKPDNRAEIVTLCYFASVRELVGRPSETVELPAGTATVADLLSWLRSRGEEYEAALGQGDVKVAVDHVHASTDVAIAGVREIAFFPRMTGG
ncbi:MAG: molybdopterin converting factor subunit 1 [Bauldia sp.]